MQGSSASSAMPMARKQDGRRSISSSGTKARHRSSTRPFAPHSRSTHNSPSTLSVCPSICPILGRPRRPPPAEKWRRWQSKWKKSAEGNQRELTITLWGRSELCARLGGGDPTYSGRVLYWFGVEALTPTWFREQFEKTRVSLGNRYIPENNVEARHPRGVSGVRSLSTASSRDRRLVQTSIREGANSGSSHPRDAGTRGPHSSRGGGWRSRLTGCPAQCGPGGFRPRVPNGRMEFVCRCLPRRGPRDSPLVLQPFPVQPPTLHRQAGTMGTASRP